MHYTKMTTISCFKMHFDWRICFALNIYYKVGCNVMNTFASSLVNQ